MMSIGKAAEVLGLSKEQMRRLDKNGVLVPLRSAGNTRYYTQEQLDEYMRVPKKKAERVVIGYCRVSSTKQKDDLDRLIESVRAYIELPKKSSKSWWRT